MARSVEAGRRCDERGEEPYQSGEKDRFHPNQGGEGRAPARGREGAREDKARDGPKAPRRVVITLARSRGSRWTARRFDKLEAYLGRRSLDHCAWPALNCVIPECHKAWASRHRF